MTAAAARSAASDERPLSVLAFPMMSSAYTVSFYKAVQAAGVRVIEGVFAGRWLRDERKAFDVVHFHWPSFYYYRNDGGWRNWLRLAKFALILAALRGAGKQIVWTGHNLYPHDGGAAPVHRAGRWLMRLFARRVFVHGAIARRTIVDVLGIDARKIVEIEHGHWIDLYPNNCTAQEARARLGLPAAAKVFLFIGQCKPYKNLDHLVRSFQTLGSDAWLVIAGSFQSPRYRAQIDAAIARRPERILLVDRFIEDAEMQHFLNAADGVVLPYSEILTSGATMLALSFGRPVVVPRLGGLIEVVTPECGVMYEPTDRDGLAKAMQTLAETPFAAGAIIAAARRYSWERAAHAFTRALG